jgi:alkanesulfonate monooxygenase SsuD/methylene tetrahydromethanopterin reductase-like flavin-dependent oxidoreductase (luciferase family)
MPAVRFGVNVDPTATALETGRAVARRADELGLDLIGVQDHPYVDRFVDTFALIATLLAETRRIHVFPNVANLPLRGPAMIAKAAASLDVLSGGRFELGIGAGAMWPAIRAMGGPDRSPGEAVDALAEAIELIRRFWALEKPLGFAGRFYAVKGVHPGPRPTGSIPIWVGAYKPRMLALTGRLADGWSVSLGYAQPDAIAAMRRRIDQAAADAGRDPAGVRRLYNLMGTIADGPVEELLHGPAEHWIDELSRFVRELGFDTLLFWPREGDPVDQLERFAGEVVPGVLARL